MAKECGLATVVVTHHCPTPKSTHESFRTGPSSELNAFFASDMTLDIMDWDPDLWIHGHTHYAFDYPVDDTGQICKTRVVCNPRGYVGYEAPPGARGFDLDKTVEVIAPSRSNEHTS